MQKARRLAAMGVALAVLVLAPATLPSALVPGLAQAQAQPAPRPPQQGQRPQQQQQQQQGPSFTLRNEGSRTLREFYASSPTENEWGPDRLGADMVGPGQSFRIQLPRGAGCAQDLRAVFDDDSTVERRGVDICRERTQAFRNPEPDTELTVVNGHARTVFQLFLRPQQQSGDEWGPDRLGSATLDVGERLAIRFSADGQCSFDLRIVFDNESAEERRAVDVCTTPVVALRPGWTTDETVPTDPGQPAAPGAGGTPGGPPGGASGGPSAGPSGGAAAPRGGTLFRNAGAVPIVRLSVDPPGAQAPGPDRLGDAVIGPGGSFALPASPGLCTGDVVATFRDGRQVRRERLELCEGAEVSLP